MFGDLHEITYTQFFYYCIFGLPYTIVKDIGYHIFWFIVFIKTSITLLQSLSLFPTTGVIFISMQQ